MEFLQVDGSFGEGGGQILRTAVVFSAVQSRPIRVTRIRAGRKEPGLKRQHASALQVLAEIFDADLQGAVEGSQEITFVPGIPQIRNLNIDMKTAGSITLVLQAVVPAVALAQSRLTLDITGGTDVPWSPTFDYLNSPVRMAYKMLGIDFSAACAKRGYYPNGGGTVRSVVEPCQGIRPIDLVQASSLPEAEVISRCGRLPKHVAERQLKSASDALAAHGVRVGSGKVSEEESESPGSSLLVYLAGNGRIMGSDSIGARGKAAEAVGREAADRMASALETGACVDANLADMLAPLLSLGREESKMRVPEVTLHLKTSLHLAQLFTGCEYSFSGEAQGVVVTITPN